MISDNDADAVSTLIDENLKRVFDETLGEEIPDRFADLLQQLRAAETADSEATKEAAQ